MGYRGNTIEESRDRIAVDFGAGHRQLKEFERIQAPTMRGEREKRENVRRSTERAKKTATSWPARMKEAAAETNVSSPLKNEYLGGKASTFFFTNFLENWSKDLLWQEFRKFGTVVDVFVARKRNKSGRKFGFGRFMRVRDIEKMEAELNNAWMDRFKLKANLDKYGRKEQRMTPEPTQKLNSIIVEHERTMSCKDSARRTGRSYAEAVNGPQTIPYQVNKDVEPIITDKDLEMNTINIISPVEVVEKLNRSLFGEVRCYEMLKNLQEFPAVEGLNDIQVRYHGGMAVSIEFRSKEAAKDYLILARGT
ncbi:hypothetical protein LXL04_027712 [Taraxacum kok-saghyz]